MRRKLKLLIAEDSPGDAFLLNRAIENTRMLAVPRFVSDGEEAIDYLAGRNGFSNRELHPMPTLIILDIKMPRKTGFEVLYWLRGQGGLRNTPVVMLSSSDRCEDVEKAYSLGVNAYMVKPCGSKRLEEMVRVIDIYWRDFCEVPIN